MWQSIKDFIENPFVIFIGGFFLLFGGWLSKQAWKKYIQPERELVCGKISLRRLISISSDFKDRVGITLDGRTVSNVHLIVFGIKNSGTAAIKAEDFKSNITFNFPNGNVISADIVSRFPEYLPTTLLVENDKFSLAPLLLNSGDRMIIQALISSEHPNHKIEGRIVEIPTFQDVNTTPRLPNIMESGIPSLFFTLMGVILSFVTYYYFQHGQLDTKIIVYMVVVFVLFIGQVAYLRLYENYGPSARKFIEESAQYIIDRRH